MTAPPQWRVGGPDRNAVIYGPDGEVLQEATLGDGIQHVLATRLGNVWVGYFDKGVYGWGDPGPAPIGAPGLIRYGPDLLPSWRYGEDERGDLDAIDDCYALNVADETAWVYYYDTFPVVRIHDGRVRGWATDVLGARALITDGHMVALVGGYGSHDQITVATLGGEAATITDRFQLTLPDGRGFPDALAVIGRGSDLHVVTEDIWYRTDLDHILH